MLALATIGFALNFWARALLGPSRAPAASLAVVATASALFTATVVRREAREVRVRRAVPSIAD